MEKQNYTKNQMVSVLADMTLAAADLIDEAAGKSKKAWAYRKAAVVLLDTVTRKTFGLDDEDEINALQRDVAREAKARNRERTKKNVEVLDELPDNMPVEIREIVQDFLDLGAKVDVVIASHGDEDQED